MKACARCGWPLKERIEDGCIEGNCSMRLLPPIRTTPDERRCAECGSLQHSHADLTREADTLRAKLTAAKEHGRLTDEMVHAANARREAAERARDEALRRVEELEAVMREIAELRGDACSAAPVMARIALEGI